MLAKLISANFLICLLVGVVVAARAHHYTRVVDGLESFLVAAWTSLIAWSVVLALAILFH